MMIPLVGVYDDYVMFRVLSVPVSPPTCTRLINARAMFRAELFNALIAAIDRTRVRYTAAERRPLEYNRE